MTFINISLNEINYINKIYFKHKETRDYYFLLKHEYQRYFFQKIATSIDKNYFHSESKIYIFIQHLKS
jgi:hypothetical protein